jgi:hypothetical protein
MSQERQRFPIKPSAVHATAGSSQRIHSEAAELGREKAAERRQLARLKARRSRRPQRG